MIETLVLILTAIDTVRTIIAAAFASKMLKRMQKLPEPPIRCGVVTFEVMQMLEPPGLPGYDRKRRTIGFRH